MVWRRSRGVLRPGNGVLGEGGPGCRRWCRQGCAHASALLSCSCACTRVSLPQDLTQELLKLSVLYTALELSDKVRPPAPHLTPPAWRSCCRFGLRLPHQSAAADTAPHHYGHTHVCAHRPMAACRSAARLAWT